MEKEELLVLYNRYADTVYRLAYSYLGSGHDAEDAVQTIFLKLAEGKAVPRPGSEKALLMQITVNYCRDELRAGGRKMTVLAAAAVLVLAFFEGRSGAGA